MKLIPIILLVSGGVMILAGVRKENPLTIVKKVLNNEGN